jgi:outer membrane receptor protein involved in Fe transport
VNLIYALSDKQNLRLGYARTLARPSFKELSFAQIIDPITNRIFNGGLFVYRDSNGNVTWDGQLKETDINNLDLRWEIFQERGQMYSISGFYKQFDNPIELIRIPEQQASTELQPRNVGDGTVYGVELELRQDLSFIAPSLSKIAMNVNVTLAESSIEMTAIEFQSRKDFERTGQTIDKDRQMAGQSPYVINFGLIYGNKERTLDLGVFYNVKGPTLEVVGIGVSPDVYTQPFHSLNFSLNKKLGEEGRTAIDLKAENLLGERTESYYQSAKADDQIFTSFNPGTTISLGFSHSF